MPPMDRVVMIDELRSRLDAVRSGGGTVGLVPTMGYLHDGHLSLARAAAMTCDHVVMTIFVNPLQFAPDEDLTTYPRDPDGDAMRAASAGVHTLFQPSEDEMYPDGRDRVLTGVAVPELSSTMEGASRRTHFGGVCTVVAKLFNIAGECRAYFGEKDYQQLAIVRRMVQDLSFPVDVVGCPIVRESDGLAMSSRNAYLSEDERRVAPVLYRSLELGAAAVRDGLEEADALRSLMAAEIESAPLGELDYVEVADPDTLMPLRKADERSRLFGAVRFGRARLIDNVGVGGTTDRPGVGPR